MLQLFINDKEYCLDSIVAIILSMSLRRTTNIIIFIAFMLIFILKSRDEKVKENKDFIRQPCGHCNDTGW